MPQEGDVERLPLLRNHLKERLAAGELTVCLRTTLAATNEIAFVAHAAGFDALYVDLEHSTASVADAAQVCSTATALGTTPLVRLDSVDDPAAVRLLEAGCQGLIAPHVETAEQAQRLVDRCLYPPLGQRSASAPGLQLGYAATPPAQLWPRVNRATLLCVLLESERGIANVEQIAAVPGVDLLLVGTQDLTHALGIPGVVDHPAVADAYEQVARAAAAVGKAFGIAGITEGAALSRYLLLGASFVSAGSDVGLLHAAARARVELVRNLARQA
jgi:4-hydroxy-2-oxoheptanedioate aldolase